MQAENFLRFPWELTALIVQIFNYFFFDFNAPFQVTIWGIKTYGEGIKSLWGGFDGGWTNFWWGQYELLFDRWVGGSPHCMPPPPPHIIGNPVYWVTHNTLRTPCCNYDWFTITFSIPSFSPHKFIAIQILIWVYKFLKNHPQTRKSGNVDLSNLENVLQRNLRTSKAGECIFRACGGTNFKNLPTGHQPWWCPEGFDVCNCLPKKL